MSWSTIKTYVTDVLTRENNVVTDSELEGLLNEAVDELNSLITPRRKVCVAADLGTITSETNGLRFEIPDTMVMPPLAVMYDGWTLEYQDPKTFNQLNAANSYASGLVDTGYYTVEGSTLRFNGSGSAALEIHAYEHLPYYKKPAAIASSTLATPIVVTTSTAHGLATGDTITISGHLTNTAANGTWTVTYVSATTFSLQTSVGNGAGIATGSYVVETPDPMAYCPANYANLPGFWALAHLHASADSGIEQSRVAQYDGRWQNRVAMLQKQLGDFRAEAYRF